MPPVTNPNSRGLGIGYEAAIPKREVESIPTVTKTVACTRTQCIETLSAPISETVRYSKAYCPPTLCAPSRNSVVGKKEQGASTRIVPEGKYAFHFSSATKVTLTDNRAEGTAKRIIGVVPGHPRSPQPHLQFAPFHSSSETEIAETAAHFSNARVAEKGTEGVVPSHPRSPQPHLPSASADLQSNAHHLPSNHLPLPTQQIPPSSPSPSTRHAVSTHHTSNYPRPSPPSFFYPDPIVPTRSDAPFLTLSSNISHHEFALNSMSTFSSFGFDFPDPSPGVKVLVFGFMVLGSVWAVLVWLVNFPSSSWSWRIRGWGKEKSRFDVEGQSKKRKRKFKGKKKPIDKLSKYALLPATSDSSSPDTASTWSSDESGIAMTSATCAWQSQLHPSPNSTEQGLRNRRHDSEALPAPAGFPPWKTSSRSIAAHLDPDEQQPRPDSAPSYTHHISTTITSTTAEPLSPLNPYIPPPPVRPRSSNEYLTAHRAFFSSTSTSHSRDLSPGHSPVPSLDASISSHFSFEDVDALEAQTTPPPPQQHRRAKSDSTRKADRKSWLEAVDGAVNRGVEALIRWTEDDGEGGLVLPVGRDD